MYVDAHELPPGASIEADVCIVGGGAAGITIARELKNTDLRVVLLESGGLQFEQATQDLYRGDSVGTPYFPLDVTRLRWWGGTTNHWEGWCRPLDPIDLVQRSWVPLSGWPTHWTELEPGYDAARRICELGDGSIAEEHWRPRLDRSVSQPLPTPSDLFRTTYWRISPPTAFGRVYGPELAAAANIRVILHATATALRRYPDSPAVERVECRCLDGPSFRVRAKLFVISCGGIETPRLLLLSNDVEPAGLGNRYGWVGRCFMEHPHALAGTLLLSGTVSLPGIYTAGFEEDGARFMASLSPSEAVLRRERLLNVGFTFDLRSRPSSRPLAEDLLRANDDRMQDEPLVQRIGGLIADLDGGRPLQLDADLSERVAFILARAEQSPNPDSRVTLSDERDRLGLRKVRLDWRLLDEDRRSIRRATELLGVQMAALGLGRVLVNRNLTSEAAWPSTLHGGNHHMGTTRMSTSPTVGVVDRNCCVHGLRNLYIAGSSVFPTAGFSNPTLTIVALAVRLAARIEATFHAPAISVHASSPAEEAPR